MATVTASPTAPVRAAGATATGSGTDTGATGFGELLAALVPGGTTGSVLDPVPATPPGVCGAGPEVSVSQEDAVVGAADSDPVVVGAAGDDTAGSRTGDPGAAVPVAVPATPPTPVDVDAALLAQARLAAMPLLAAATATPVTPAAGLPVVPAAPAGPAGPAPGPTVPVLADPAGVAAPPDAPVATPTAGGQQAGPGAEQSPGPPPAPVPAPGAPATAPERAASDPAPLVLVAPGTGAPAPAAGAAARPVDAVPGQVLPEVVRLSQAGPGTHRLTLRLDPGTLGEVRVTLTVREGEVQVRLAAQHDAREVLAQAAPELRRLLEQVGGVDARVAVADLASGTTTDQSGGGSAGDDRASADLERGDGSASYDGAERRPPGPAPDTEPDPAAERDRAARARSGLDLAL